MNIQEFFNYLHDIKLLDEALPEFSQMNEEDLRLVLNTILPVGMNTDKLVEEILEWQVINQDTMKK